ncbi:response regulator transcription factor [Paenibacillus guangzhouensis]|uniref:response regulator transcription factor n=1 Tax=Paenibacillus guangzhouensis TaxID=1473112 RepID=UPI00187B555E|nr:response regulator [Paenibacillus guangzhouensis]
MRVLIVEDDRLVRKGFISLMPWDQFGMQIIGEAGNGEDALEFLADHEIDLLITDLAMPRMNGIELIRIVRDRYPRIWTVVLTFHQDFEYIQEALRLGAIDYIAKTELQQDKMEEVLQRIVQRIGFDKSHQAQVPDSQHTHTTAAERAIVWMAQPFSEEFSIQPTFAGEPVEEYASGIWVRLKPNHLSFDDIEKELQKDPFLRDGVIMLLEDINGKELRSVVSGLRQYRERFMFYAWDEREGRIWRESYDSLLQMSEHKQVTDEEMQRLKNSWSSLHWVIHDEQYEDLIAELQEIKIEPSQLDMLFIAAATRWERIVPEGLWDSSVHTKGSWSEWKSWLDQLRSVLAGYLFKPTFSEEVVSCVWKACESIHRDLSRSITLREVALEVNLSQSYLSQCFRDIVGTSFNDYVRQARMDWAKKLLLDTNKPIYWIAVQTGYMNEKYFSRVFREQTGMLPSIFRSIQAEHK